MSGATIAKDEVERILGILTVGAATLAMVGVLLASEYIAVSRPFLLGAAPLALTAAFGVLAILYVHYGR